MNRNNGPFALRAALALVLLALSASAGAADVGPPIPAPRGFVTDEAGVIPTKKARVISAVLTELGPRSRSSRSPPRNPSTISTTRRPSSIGGSRASAGRTTAS